MEPAKAVSDMLCTLAASEMGVVASPVHPHWEFLTKAEGLSSTLVTLDTDSRRMFTPFTPDYTINNMSELWIKSYFLQQTCRL